MTVEDLQDGRQRSNFDVPTRGLIGFWSFIINLTKGTGVVNSEFVRYDEFRGEIKKVLKGAIISTITGTTTAYALRDVETKG